MRDSFQGSPSAYERFIKQGLPATHDPIELTDGRIVRIAELFQFEIYAGLFEGEPNAELNKELIEKTLSYAKDKIWSPTRLMLIPPVMREPGITERDRKTYGVVDQPQYLPGAACIAQLESFFPTQDKDMFGSMLTVVWFQERYPFPIDPQVLQCIKKLDWNNLASDYAP
ncbi:MAG: hypothetical protein JW832_07015 [Deltaproteobacteria bacterium]|nr:hypothetical protein [Deltaproteobacteria bacterium]